MESELHNHTPMMNDEIPSRPLSDSLIHSPFFQLNAQNESLIGLPMFSSLQREPFIDLHRPLNRSNLNFHEFCLGGTSLDMNNSLVSLQQEVGPPYASSSSTLNCAYDDLIGDQSRFLMNPELNWRTSTSGLEPIQLSENHQDANQWVFQNSQNNCSTHLYGTSRSYNNELSLSLATSERSSRGNKEHSLDFASNSRSTQFSQIISGSRYLTVLQQILSDIASYSLESVDHNGCSNGLVSYGSNFLVSSNYFVDQGTGLKGNEEFPVNEGSFESKKSQLLALLQVVDDRYNRCIDEIHTVISAFHAVSELDPQVHACFALQTISYFYKNLRERISNEILSMGGMDSGISSRSNGRSFEKSFIQKQWALQQLKRKDQQLWRPQRGLPERSVSVLRAWMFDNFLHPYPKDAEKHLLAIKSGLTRSQVSNWFINARVRLWKPLVEEMCAELNRRKAGDPNEYDEASNSGNSNSSRSQLSIIYGYNQRFNT